MPDFDPSFLNTDDYEIAEQIIGRGMYEPLFEPVVSIMPNGEPYLYRWHVIPRSKTANVYFHIQVNDDPREELHDHKWDNTSIILAGGYVEVLDPNPKHRPPGEWTPGPGMFVRSKGDVIFRRAEWSHRLLLTGHPYTMTLFTTGPKIRDWGYWFPDGWHHNKRHNVLIDGVRVFKEEV
jgi:hypothetical protein